MPKGSKILMADDDQMLLEMYKERLDLSGYQTIACSNGEDLVKKVKDFAPDLIMLDVMMPKMDGYTTLAALKSDPQSKNIPVIMLTALMRDFNREKAIDSGADDYLIKSEAMPSDVIAKIEQVLTNYNKGFGATQTPSAPVTKPEEKNETIEFTPLPAPNRVPLDSNPVGVPPKPQLAPLPPEIKEVTEKPIEERAPITITATSSVGPESEPKSYRMIWTVIIVILLTSFANDLIMYFLFIAKR